MNYAKEVGYAGESVACDFLISLGYQILKRNFISRYGEIDIIAKSPEGILVYVEVKTYQPYSLVHPLEAITRSKIQKILKTIKYYQFCFEAFEISSRVDVIVVTGACVREHCQNVVQI